MSLADEISAKVARALFAQEGVAGALGIELGATAEGYAQVFLTVGQAMLNGHGTAHGGMIFTLADTAFAYACNSRNQTTVAQQASITFLSPARAGERLMAEARERGVGGRSGVYEVVVSAPDGRVVAVFQGLSRVVGGHVVHVD